MSGQPIVAFPDHVQSTFQPPAFSGGGWVPGMPLSNLATGRLTEVARSVSADQADTQFVIDLGVQRDLLVIAIPKSNISRTGRVRVLIATDSGFVNVVYDSGLVDYWRVVYPFGQLPFGHPSFWDGRLSAEEAQGYPMPWLVVLPQPINARYIKIGIVDEDNDDGFIDVARVLAAPGWRSSRRATTGVQFGWLPGEVMNEAYGGARSYEKRQPPRRRIAFSLDLLPRDELMTWPSEIQRRLGISGQVFVIFDPDDAVNLHRLSFLATAGEVNPLTMPLSRFTSAALVFEEVTQ